MWNWSRLKSWFRPRPAATVYTRRDCGLCDTACEVLVRHGLKPNLIDIDTDPALYQRFTNCVPVVFIDGVERFRGCVNEVLLRRLLSGRRSKAKPHQP